MRTRSFTIAAFAALVVSGLAAPVGAEGLDVPVTVESTDPTAFAVPLSPVLVVEPDAPAAPSTFGPVLALDRLDDLRGGTAVTTIGIDTQGRVDGNTATNVIGAPNVVADGSFGNAAGISTVIQNSGSNVLIQNSTVVNVSFVDPSR